MAEQSGQERTEQPTSKRLQEAREKGQLPRSRELTTAMVLLAGSGSLLFLGEGIVQGLQDVMRGNFVLEREVIFDSNGMMQHMQFSLTSMLVALAPLLVLLTLVAVLSPLALSGWTFSAQAMAFKFEKLDPIKGLGKIFAWRGLVELAKALAKFLLIGSTAILLVWFLSDRFLNLGYSDVASGLADMTNLLGWVFVVLCSTMLIVAAVDVPFQLWDHKNKLMMTKQEIRDELKQTDGSPEVKGRIRRMQQELARSRMMAEVPHADVIVTNPTHYAVALRYDQKKMGAPILVAKGQELVAAEIRRLALENKIPLVSAPPLARALYFSTDLNREIPAGLYKAVAQVLAYVFQLRHSGKPRRNQGTHRMSDLPIPDEFKRD